MKNLTKELDNLLQEEDYFDDSLVLDYTLTHNSAWEYWKSLPKSSKYLDTYTAKSLGKNKALTVLVNDLRFVDTVISRLEKIKQDLLSTKNRLEKGV